jgi:hypothetical protein
MGFAIPTAIGVRMAKPDRPIVALVGDGGFSMTALELLTAVREGGSLIVIVLVDGAFGQIRLQQLASYGFSHGVSLENPDFRLLAEAVGASHQLVGKTDIESVVRAALGNSGVTIIEVPVGDTFAIRRTAAVARAREATRRVTGPRVFRSLANAVRRVGRMITLCGFLLGVPVDPGAIMESGAIGDDPDTGASLASADPWDGIIALLPAHSPRPIAHQAGSAKQKTGTETFV